MKHPIDQSLLSAYVDKELSEEDLARVAQHLSVCEGCRREERLLRKVSSTVVSVAEYSLPQGFTQAVVRSVRQEKERSAAWRPVEQFSGRVVLALSVAVIVFVTVGSLIQPEPPVVIERYLVGEPADSLTSRTLMVEEQLSKDDLLLAAMIR